MQPLTDFIVGVLKLNGEQLRKMNSGKMAAKFGLKVDDVEYWRRHCLASAGQ